ncbi:MAG: hypothetical protein RLZZ519_1057 [Bacteroidota bacterium]|jgi:hypothetical protein
MDRLIHILLFAIIYGIGEILANWLLFPWLMRRYLPPIVAIQPEKEEVQGDQQQENPQEDAAKATHQREVKARLKGLLERLVLFLGLAAGIDQVLTLFSALKLGTHFLQKDLKETDSEKISKDYFLIGNLLSVLLSLIYLVLWKLFADVLPWQVVFTAFGCN